jgi:uncharacterized protein (UPF0333 family)
MPQGTHCNITENFRLMNQKKNITSKTKQQGTDNI